MHVGLKVGIAAAGAGVVGALAGKLIGTEGDDRFTSLGVAGSGAFIASAGALVTGAPRWSPALVFATTGAAYLLGTVFGDPDDGVRNLAPGLPQNEQEWDEAIERSGIGRGLQLPERDYVPDNPRL